MTALPSGVVTFLLSDVVGSTRLWEADADSMSAALARHERIVESAVTENHGVVVKPRGEGDSTFCVFQQPLAAVLAAVQIQDRMGSERWATPEPIVVRIAVHTGAAIERDGDYFGRVVNRAARLRGVAAPGQVLLSRTTAELVLDQLPAGLTFRSLGTQRLRDISRPEEVFSILRSGAEPSELAGPSAEATVEIPLPARLRQERELPFVGRQPERDLLATMTKRVLAGERQVVILKGEAGIGKTSLATEIAREAQALGATVIAGECDEEIRAPYKPFVEALDHLMGHLPAWMVEQHARGTALSLLVPGAPAGATPAEPLADDADTERVLLFRAVEGLLAETARTHPVVVLIDDLQWAEDGTLLLFKHLAVRCDPFPLLLIGAARHEGRASAALDALLADLRRYTDVHHVSLGGLSAGEIEDLVELAAGHRLDHSGRRLAVAVHEESDGNPFFATELLRNLDESGAVVREDDRWMMTGSLRDLGFPDSIRDVVRQRVDRLDAALREILPIAAVIGREFDLDVLAHAVARSEDDVLDELDRGLGAGVIIEVTGTAERFAFSHRLVQHTLYETLSASRRARVHARIVAALEQVGGPSLAQRADELAYHALAARRPGDRDGEDRAVAYCQLAGEVALGRFAPDAARDRYGEAWQILEQNGEQSTPEAVDVLIGLGDAQRQSGRSEFRETLLQAARTARALGDAERLVRAALTNNRGTYSQTGVVDHERVEILEAALDALGDGNSHPARPRLLAMLASEKLSDSDLAYRMTTTSHAVTLARDVDEETLAQVLALRFETVWVPESHPQRLAETEELLAITGRGGSRALAFFAARLRNLVCWEAGRISEADEQLAREEALASELGQPYMRWVAALATSARIISAGELEEGEERMNRAFEIGGQSGQPEAVLAFGGQLFGLRRQQGRCEELLPMMTTLPDDIEMRPSLALLHVENGDLAAARHTLGDYLDRPLPRPRHQVDVVSSCHLAEVVAALDRVDAAASMHEMAAPWRGLMLVDQITYSGAIDHHAGLLAMTLGRYDDAIRLLAQAEQAAAAVPLPFWVHEARVARAKALLRRDSTGDLDAGRVLLEQTARSAGSSGFTGVVRKATAALAEEG